MVAVCELQARPILGFCVVYEVGRHRSATLRDFGGRKQPRLSLSAVCDAYVPPLLVDLMVSKYVLFLFNPFPFLYVGQLTA